MLSMLNKKNKTGKVAKSVWGGMLKTSKKEEIKPCKCWGGGAADDGSVTSWFLAAWGDGRGDRKPMLRW